MDRRILISRRRSGEIARRRLKILLTTDKTGVPPETLEMLKRDLCSVVSRYMDIEPSRIEICVRPVPHEPDDAAALPSLCTVIPIKGTIVKGTF